MIRIQSELKNSGCLRVDLVNELDGALKQRLMAAGRAKGVDRALALYDVADCLAVLRKEFESAANLAAQEPRIAQVLPARRMEGASNDPFSPLVGQAFAERDRLTALMRTFGSLAGKAAREEMDRIGLIGPDFADVLMGHVVHGRVTHASQISNQAALDCLLDYRLLAVSETEGKVSLTELGHKVHKLYTNVCDEDSYS